MPRRKPFLALSLLLLVVVGTSAALIGPRESQPDLTAAAQGFLASLSEKQRATATMDFATPQRFGWHFIPKRERKGLQMRDMQPGQRKAARALLAASLSEIGYRKADQIMELEKILHKVEGSQARFKRDYLRYYFTLFGQPAREGKWGLSIEGHHLSLNFVIEDGQITAHTPAFLGANPGLVMGDVGVGPKKGARVLKDEELLAFALLKSLSPDQRKTAVIADKAPRDIRGAGDKQPPITAPEGLPARKMNEQQVATLKGLITAYANNMRKKISQADLAAIDKAGIEKVHFAWAGADRPGIGHYYRLQGPTFLVEFCNTQPDAAGNPANHIHTVWRDLSGDFGAPIQGGQ